GFGSSRKTATAQLPGPRRAAGNLASPRFQTNSGTSVQVIDKSILIDLNSPAQRIAPAAFSAASSEALMPQSAIAASVCCPGVGAGPLMDAGVRWKRGAGAGCNCP